MARKIGVDLGGSWLRIGAVDTNSNTRPHVERYPSPDNWQDFVDLLSRHNTHEVEGFGVAISGPIENHTTVIDGANLPWLSGRNVGRDLRTALKRTVVIANDMEAATEGEMARGVLRHYAWAIFDTISTGWGGNLILNGMRVDGEPGHANVTFDSSYRCGAGHIGCYEAFYSGSAWNGKSQPSFLRFQSARKRTFGRPSKKKLRQALNGRSNCWMDGPKASAEPGQMS